MQKWVLSCLLFVPIIMVGQVEITNASLSKPNLKLLYIGIDNKIEISGLKTMVNLNLIASQGSAKGNEAGVFYVKASSITPDTLKLYQNNKLILTEIYEVRKIGEIVPRFGNLKDTIASVRQILRNTTLYAVIPECYIIPLFQIRSFNVTIWRAHGQILLPTESNRGPFLSPVQIRMIKELRKGDKIMFTRIELTCPDCTGRLIKPLTITVN